MKHSKLADGVEQALQNKKYVTGVDVSQLDMCYPAIIQSGSNYSLKFSTVRSANVKSRPQGPSFALCTMNRLLCGFYLWFCATRKTDVVRD